MNRLDYIREFANQTNFGVSGPLTNREVNELAEQWLPDLRFDQRELYHPISFDTLLGQPLDVGDWVQAIDPATGKNARWPSPVVLENGAGSTFASTTLDRSSKVTTLRDGGDEAQDVFGSIRIVDDRTRPRFDLSMRAEFRWLLEDLEHNMRARQDSLFGDELESPCFLVLVS